MAIRFANNGGDVKILTGKAYNKTTNTVSVDLGGKPKMLVAKIVYTAGGNAYAVRSWNGTEMISSKPKGINEDYTNAMKITITDTGFIYYNDWINTYHVEYTAII